MGLKKSDNMAWWKGMDIEYGKETIHVDRVPISGIYKIKVVGGVLAGRVSREW